jgi:molybdopterin synthase catalytic subunit
VHITLRLYAVLRAREGAADVVVTLEAGATLADLLMAYFSTRPDQALLRPHLRIAHRDQLLGLDVDLASVTVRDGDRVALLPPASGGADELSAYLMHGSSDGHATRRLVHIAPAPLDARLPERLAALITAPTDGAVVTFTGMTRVTPGTAAPGEEAAAARVAGERVVALEYEAADALAISTLGSICDALLTAGRGEIGGIAVVHAIGRVPVGAVSLYSVVSGPHRDRVYAASTELISELKRSVPIWKAEHFESGIVWGANPDAL